jgi:small subunit ribosomal protein S7
MISKGGNKMPRKGPVAKREILPDPIYHSTVITKFINQLMWDGKRSKAESIFYEACELIRTKTGKNPVDVFEQAMKNVMPMLEVKARRVGGANYQVPVEVRADRRQALAIRWLVGYTRKRGEKDMVQKLAAELMDAANGTGGSVKKREDTHKMSERWFIIIHLIPGDGWMNLRKILKKNLMYSRGMCVIPMG